MIAELLRNAAEFGAVRVTEAALLEAFAEVWEAGHVHTYNAYNEAIRTGSSVAFTGPNPYRV